MKRINISFTDQELEALTAKSLLTGLCRSDLVRRAVDILYVGSLLKPNDLQVILREGVKQQAGE